VTAMLIQNTNPANIDPEQRLVRRGFARNDLFVAVHEQLMTEKAEIADIVIPATMFVEHEDIYRAGGQNHILLGPKL
ncbi:molybdopterin-dependent oxidoreductase, partial [Rhizobium ruizarguesonis]